jgi:tetratricopeptide (TPR) repeat protein
MFSKLTGEVEDDLREIDKLAGLIARADPAASEDVRAAGRRALTLEHEGDEYEAGEQYLRMVEPSRGSVPVYRHAAFKLIEMERCGDALELADEVAQLNGRDSEAYQALGEICEATGAYAIAALAYREALELGAESGTDLRLRLAHMLHNLGRHETSAETFREALALATGDFADYLTLGHSLLKLRLYSEAAEACVRATELEPSSGEAHASLGLAHAEAGSHAEAITALRRCLELGGHYDGKMHGALGRAFFMLGMYEDAAATYEEELRRWDCSHCREGLARAHEAEGRYK